MYIYIYIGSYPLTVMVERVSQSHEFSVNKSYFLNEKNILGKIMQLYYYDQSWLVLHKH